MEPETIQTSQSTQSIPTPTPPPTPIQQTPPSSPPRIFIIAAVTSVIVLLLISAGASWYFFKRPQPSSQLTFQGSGDTTSVYAPKKIDQPLPPVELQMEIKNQLKAVFAQE